MRITLITCFYPPDTGGGGIAAYARYAAVGLTRAGHQVCVISATAKHSKARQTDDGVDIFRISSPFGSYYWTRLPLLGRHIRFIRDLVYAWRVRQTLLKMTADFRPDIVEYADIDAEGSFHPRQLCPYVVKLHTPHAVLRAYYSNKEVPYALGGIEWLEKKAIRQAAGISSPSYYLAQEIEKKMNIAQGCIQYIPNFIDTEVFSPRLNVSEEQPLLVLYVGRLEAMKGAPVFGQAIPLIADAFPKAKFTFLGKDHLAKSGQSQQLELQHFFAQAGLQEHVEFHGHSSPEMFLSFYRQASVFVLPSLFENSPYTLLEAMACGKACVVSRTGGMTEMLVDGESGLYFDPGNPKDLAEKVIGLLRNSEQRNSMGLAARQRIEQEYSLNVGVEKTVSFYQNVLSKTGKAH